MKQRETRENSLVKLRMGHVVLPFIILGTVPIAVAVVGARVLFIKGIQST
ncbi:MAG: hypothetical protein QM773_15745 [Hyphomonadaceae bacterium]